MFQLLITTFIITGRNVPAVTTSITTFDLAKDAEIAFKLLNEPTDSVVKRSAIRLYLQ
jgi:hypothetical protein